MREEELLLQTKSKNAKIFLVYIMCFHSIKDTSSTGMLKSRYGITCLEKRDYRYGEGGIEPHSLALSGLYNKLLFLLVEESWESQGIFYLVREK